MKKIFLSFLVVLCACISILVATVFGGPHTQDMYCPVPYDLHWSGRTAKWSVDGWASKYQVALYRDGHKVKTKTVTSRSCSFSSLMSRGDNDYFFRVRAYNKDNAWWSDWEESEIIEIRHDGSGDGNGSRGSKGPGTVVPGAAPGESGSIVTTSGKWVQSVNGKWKYKFNNGTYAIHTWLSINGKWYYVDANGDMVTGWLNDSGKQYFLNPDGTMVTGTVIFDGVTHFFDSNGVMIY